MILSGWAHYKTPGKGIHRIDKVHYGESIRVGSLCLVFVIQPLSPIGSQFPLKSSIYFLRLSTDLFPTQYIFDSQEESGETSSCKMVSCRRFNVALIQQK